MGRFNVYRYEDARGNDRIREFVMKSTKNQKAKISRQIEHLETYGISSKNPALKKISRTNIWEMRSLGKIIFEYFVHRMRMELFYYIL